MLGENWAVFSYLSTSNQRNEIAVLEFYDAQQRSLSIPSLLFDTQNSTRSSYTPTPLEVSGWPRAESASRSQQSVPPSSMGQLCSSKAPYEFTKTRDGVVGCALIEGLTEV